MVGQQKSMFQKPDGEGDFKLSDGVSWCIWY